ncbi:MAG: branched-chain amino acid ABC transporter permease, partial [Desulfatitalea sp.]
THAWLLYFGLLFVGMVLWAPNGLAGLIMQHEPVWKAGLIKRLLPSYLTTLVPLLVMLLGVMLLVEINYHLSLSINPEDPLELFGIAFNARSPVAWALAIVLIGVGFFFFRKAGRWVNQSWNEVTQVMKGGR